jgi:multisubunit Na+/H+ antiporter MnhB subunit
MKATKISAYILSGAVFITAVILFFIFTIHAPLNVGKGGEALGWVTAACMAFLLILFVFKTLFLSKKPKPELKARLLPV